MEIYIVGFVLFRISFHGLHAPRAVTASTGPNRYDIKHVSSIYWASLGLYFLGHILTIVLPVSFLRLYDEIFP